MLSPALALAHPHNCGLERVSVILLLVTELAFAGTRTVAKHNCVTVLLLIKSGAVGLLEGVPVTAVNVMLGLAMFSSTTMLSIRE